MNYKRYLRTYFWLTGILVFVNLISIAAFIYEPKSFYYRPWEYFPEIAYKFSRYDASWNKEETSDLTRDNYFYYQDPHSTHVSVDEDGYRSNLTKDNYKILISGDSTVFGSGLSDNETLPWQLSEKITLTTFNGGRSDLRNTLLKPELANVKLVIDCITERSIKQSVFPDYGFEGGNVYQPISKNDKSIYALLNEVPAQRYLATSIAVLSITRGINDLIILITGNRPKTLFLRHTFNEFDLETAVKSIVKRSEAMKAQGLEYIFVAIPAKQSIYGTDVDEFTRNYIEILTQQLIKEGVKTIDLLNPFLRNKSIGLYRDFDTHWNPNGVSIAATTISHYLVDRQFIEQD